MLLVILRVGLDRWFRGVEPLPFIHPFPGGTHDAAIRTNVSRKKRVRRMVKSGACASFGASTCPAA
jgi:hypothetical protein